MFFSDMVNLHQPDCQSQQTCRAIQICVTPAEMICVFTVCCRVGCLSDFQKFQFDSPQLVQSMQFMDSAVCELHTQMRKLTVRCCCLHDKNMWNGMIAVDVSHFVKTHCILAVSDAVQCGQGACKRIRGCRMSTAMWHFAPQALLKAWKTVWWRRGEPISDISKFLTKKWSHHQRSFLDRRFSSRDARYF